MKKSSTMIWQKRVNSERAISQYLYITDPRKELDQVEDRTSKSCSQVIYTTELPTRARHMYDMNHLEKTILHTNQPIPIDNNKITILTYNMTS